MNNRILSAVSGRLSLRAPQRESLEALAQAIAASDGGLLDRKRDIESLLSTLSAEFATLNDFEREFPSLCFALATGVGKTRLMGAFISYLHLAHGISNFFVLAPNLTIYDKLIKDFTPGSPKYVFKGIAEFATNPPDVITGDDYEQRGAHVMGDIWTQVRVNVFNISKINSEVRGGKAPRIKRLSEYLGDSYFNYLSQLPDLVLLMDESHRYRASAGVRALNELNPLLGLELTATPFTESNQGPVAFKNVVVDYPLARAMDDGFVKEPAVVTQRNFNAKQFTKDQIERIKLKDGIRLHEVTKVELATYAKQNGVFQVKPFMLVIARDTTHAAQLLETIELDDFFEGRYKGKVIQVDSSQSGAAEENMIARLLSVESFDEPTEVVIHVNMLKEGWDVTNLYTIVPLRAANARTLIEQSIGRGLRLPYGKRTGVDAVDRLSIVAHDRFQEIVDEANNPENPLRMRQIILEAADIADAKDSVSITSTLQTLVTGEQPTSITGFEYTNPTKHEPVFAGVAEREVAKVALSVLQSYQHKPNSAPTSQALLTKEMQGELVNAVSERITGRQQSLLEEVEKVDLEAVVAKTTELMVQQTIDIPRIIVVPTGDVTYGYHPFSLELSQLNLQPSNRELISQSLQTNQQISISAQPQKKYTRLEDYIVEQLVDYDDIAYEEHAGLIYDLAGQVVRHFEGIKEYSEDEMHNIFFGYARLISENIHVQMSEHFWENASGYETTVRSGFTPIKDTAYTTTAGQAIHNFRDTVANVGKIKQMMFGGFAKCLYTVQKFDSDTERRFSIILERDALKWFKPAKGQFQIYYKAGVDQKEYVPDFIAETDDVVLMCETKARGDIDSQDVQAKTDAAKEWITKASDYLTENGGKKWMYLLIPHDEVVENRSLKDYKHFEE